MRSIPVSRGPVARDLNSLLARVEKTDVGLADELRSHIDGLAKRREFGLNFERHTPEHVPLVGMSVAVGGKAIMIPPRGEVEVGDALDSDSAWVVVSIDDGVATLVHPDSGATATRAVEDLMYAADFRDPIYPGLKSTEKVERGGTKPFHTVINAENYHALECLLFTHQGKVDAIYIDPPYNTGARDWKYNNDYVGEQDSYKHSKWLAFMERRLKLAKKLLNPVDSVLIATIDEKEYLRLGLLLEQTFPGCRIQMVSTSINPSGSARGKEFYRVDEYIFFVYVGAAEVQEHRIAGLYITPSDRKISDLPEEREAPGIPKVRWESLLRSGSGASRAESELKFYPVLVDPKAAVIVDAGSPLPLDQHPEDYTPPKGLVAVWPIRKDGSEGRWQLNQASFRALLKDSQVKIGNISQGGQKITVLYLPSGLRGKLAEGSIVVVGKDKYGGYELAYSAADVVSARPKTQWSAKSHSATDHGSSLLRRLIPGRKFPYPKSLYAVEDSLRFFISHKPNAVVLDFFGGSGTTTHAVMRLNKQDNGRRSSIVVTNNEVSADEQETLRKKGLRPGDAAWEALGICDYITQPRIKAAVTGLTPGGTPCEGNYPFTDVFPIADGFEENVEFFDLTYENPDLVEVDLAFERIAPLLWLRAGSQGRRIDTPSDTFDVTDTYAVLFQMDAAANFLREVRKADLVRTVFIVTDDEPQFQAIAAQIPHGVTAVRLYETYLRTFEINTIKE